MNIEAMHSRLADIEKTYNEISEQLMSEEVLANPREVTKLSREQARLTALVWRQDISCRNWNRESNRPMIWKRMMIRTCGIWLRKS